MRRSNSSRQRKQHGARAIRGPSLARLRGVTINPFLPPHKPRKSLKKGGKAMPRVVNAALIEFLQQTAMGPEQQAAQYSPRPNSNSLGPRGSTGA
jgi:hypothetical protein